MAGFVFGNTCFLCVDMLLLHALVLCDLCYFSLIISFRPLEVGYKATKVFDSGSIEYFGGQVLYWVLFNFGKVKKWFQYNDLKVFWGFFVM